MSSERDLYPSIELWLKRYLVEKYPGFTVETTFQSSNIKLGDVLRKEGLRYSNALLLNIKIDIVGILKKNEQVQLVLVEVKKNQLSLKDLGQLWGYTQLINPIESFLISPVGLGAISELYHVLKRRDIFLYGLKREKTMRVALWDAARKSIDYSSIIPKS
ncbi:MAG: hypothetical protein ACYCSG_00085 [Thermoplasmataceae archaeon]